jgi:KDO2-lipid IV(A) lauroyltransferase
VNASDLLGLLAGRVLRIRRGHVERAMRRAGIEPSAIGRTADRMYASLGRGVLELFRFRADPGAPSPYRMTPALVDALDRARSTGAVLASGHTGNWELAGARIAREIGLTAIVQRQSVGWAHRFIERVRHAAGIELLYPDSAVAGLSPLAGARRALAGKRAVFMMIDQRPAVPRHAVAGEFLGAPVSIARAPAVLAARSGAPIHLLGMHREGDTLHLDLLATYAPPPRAGRQWVDATMTAATRRLDAFVRAHPTDWMWLHRRWSPLRHPG